jgi:hypothetical protein
MNCETVFNRKPIGGSRLARMEMLSAFGKTEEMHAAMDRHFLLVESKPGEANNAVRG